MEDVKKDRRSIVLSEIQKNFDSNILSGFLSISCSKVLTVDEYQEELKKYVNQVVEILMYQCGKDIVLSEWKRHNNNRELKPYSIFEYDKEQHIEFVRAEGYIEGVVLAYIEREFGELIRKSIYCEAKKW